MQTSSMYVPPLSKLNRSIIITMVSLFLLNSIMGLSGNMGLLPWLGLSWKGLTSGLIYQPLTYVFMESSFLGVLFNSLLIWFIGSDLELKWGARFYAKYLIVCTLASAIVYVVVSAFGFGGGILSGSEGITYGLLVAYGLIYSERMLTFMLIFPMKAKYFCLILAGVQLYLSVFSTHGIISLVHLSAMLTGFLYLNLLSMKARGKDLKSLMAKRHKNKMRKNLYIVSDDEKQKANPKDPRFWQ